MALLRRVAIVTAATAAVAVSWPHSAHACSSIGLEEFIAEPSGDDTAQPGAIGEPTVAIRRGRGPDCKLGSCQSTSCDDIGSIQLTFDLPTDNVTPSEDLAYRIEVVDGEAPMGVIPTFAFRGQGPGKIFLEWADGATDDQEPIAFTIVVYTLDAAGNESPASPEIEISDPGGSEGCRVSEPGGGATGWGRWAWLPILVLGARVRRPG